MKNTTLILYPRLSPDCVDFLTVEVSPELKSAVADARAALAELHAKHGTYGGLYLRGIGRVAAYSDSNLEPSFDPEEIDPESLCADCVLDDECGGVFVHSQGSVVAVCYVGDHQTESIDFGSWLAD